MDINYNKELRMIDLSSNDDPKIKGNKILIEFNKIVDKVTP